MGGRVYRCTSCDFKCNIYNSCTDRHCPQCVGARRADWLAKTEKLLRSEVTYFQVIFTLPEQLSALALGNRSVLYKLLFGSAWKALSKSIRDELGMRPAAAKVLHTWNQRLEHHPHIHALVPGCGPSLDCKSWIPCRMTKGTIHEPPKPFLVDNKRLGWQFRDAFIAGVARLQKAGKLKVVDSVVLDAAHPAQGLYAIKVLRWLEQYTSQRLRKKLRRAIASVKPSPRTDYETTRKRRSGLASTGQKVSEVRMRDGVRVSDPPSKLAGTVLWRAPALVVAQRREWLKMSELSDTSAHPKSPQSNTEDKSSGLDLRHNQAIRTVTIGRTGDSQLAGKHAASMLQMLLPVC